MSKDCGAILLEKLGVVHLVLKFTSLSSLKSASELYCDQDESSPHLPPLHLRFFEVPLYATSHLRLGVISSLVPLGFLLKSGNAFLISPMLRPAPCFVCRIPFHLIAVVISGAIKGLTQTGDEYRVLKRVGGLKRDEVTGGNCITRNFVICTLRQI
jgi:hypothetical protein